MPWWGSKGCEAQEAGAGAVPPDRRRPVFVNRTKECRIFEEAVRAIPPDRTAIRVFHGIGGQGKTALAEHLFTLTKAETAARFDFVRPARIAPGAAPEPDRLLVKLRNAFSGAGVSFPAFDLAFAVIWERTRSDQPLPRIDNPWLARLDEASDAVSAEFTELTMETIKDVVEDVPFIGHLVSRITRWGVRKARVAYLHFRHDCLAELERSIDLVPDEELIGFLPGIMAYDLRRFVERNEGSRLVLFIDEYDRVFDGGGAGPVWSRNQSDEFLREVAARAGGLLMVFFSRFPLPWDDMPDLSGDPDAWQQELDGLTERDADDWLVQEQVSDAAIRARIIDASCETVQRAAGAVRIVYPLVLELNLLLYRQLGGPGRALPDDAFEIGGGHRRAHCRRIVKRLLGDYPGEVQVLFETLSPLDRFDRKTFEHVCRAFNIGLPFDTFHRLEDLSIVSQAEEGWLKLHSVVGDIIWELVDSRRRDGIVARLSAHLAERARPEQPKQAGEEAGLCLEEGFRLRLRNAPESSVAWLAETGETLRLAGRHRLLERLWTECFAVCRETFGEDAAELALVSSHLGACLDGQARFADAQAHHRRALDIVARQRMDGTAAAAFVKSNMAHGLVEIGSAESLDRARTLQQEALAVYRAGSGADGREAAVAHLNLARIAVKLREWAVAEDSARAAIDRLTGAEGAADAALIDARSLLGVVLDYRFQEQRLPALRDEAHALHLAALQKSTELFGANHPATASTLVHLAEHHSIQGEYRQADAAFAKAAQSLKEALGELHPKSIRAHVNKGTNRFLASRYDDALHIYREVLDLAIRAMGPGHYLVGQVRLNIGKTLLERDARSAAEAVGELRRAGSILARNFPETHYLRAECRAALSAACARAGLPSPDPGVPPTT